MKKMQAVNLKDIQIQDPFWSKHIELVDKEIIPYQWEAMNDRVPGAEPSRCLENFKIAAGLKSGVFYGAVFQDTDIAKWLEAVGFSLINKRDEDLEQRADEVIELIGKAQQDDGYLDTYYIIQAKEKRWSNLCEGHELYIAGHMMEAAVAYYQGTGKKRFLEIVCKNADLICRTFGTSEGQIKGYPGHQEVEIGLIKLYHVTGERKYLDQAKYFIDARGVGENYFLKEMSDPDFQHFFPEFANYDPSYSQSHLPVREQTTAEGHAVRATYMYTAMAELAYEYQDEELLNACQTLWDNLVNKRMYLTGGIGSSGILERFTVDYDLPNDYCYCESCASIGLAMFGLRMAQITREGKYMDVVERALYNTILAGVALDGKSFFYVNPLEVWPESCKERTSKEHVKPMRQKWFGVACCPPNIARTLASLGQYIYSVDSESIYVNLFVSNKTKIRLDNKEVGIELNTRFPRENSLQIAISNVPVKGVNLGIRMPDYAQDYQVIQEGKVVEVCKEKGYALLNVNADGVFDITFQAPARFIRSNVKVRANTGKVALVRGPQVYCLEEVDNGANLAALKVDTDSPIKEVPAREFGGSIELLCRGKRILEEAEEPLYTTKPLQYKEVEIKAIPYSYWNNRGLGEMSVWLRK
ncbi:glycoside hydrolase family 127 protein [Lachnospiraceae bacterium OttesenSCG-928-J05]|nr:glycoside hydrolase family 127 protein [Lachnospiraceae bacterium OttesenSCG-928-J05]